MVGVSIRNVVDTTSNGRRWDPVRNVPLTVWSVGRKGTKRFIHKCLVQDRWSRQEVEPGRRYKRSFVFILR